VVPRAGLCCLFQLKGSLSMARCGDEDFEVDFSDSSSIFVLSRCLLASAHYLFSDSTEIVG